jgi:hypothetical protein
VHVIGKIALGAIIAGSFGVWGYAYSGYADRVTPDTLDDSTFAVAAEQICTTSMATFEALPNAEVATDNVDRASQIVARDQVLTSMLDQLDAEITGTPRDIEIISEWLVDWRTFVAEREDYAKRFSLDDTEMFYVSAVGGERLEKRITRFANTNEMYHCVTPTDVG